MTVATQENPVVKNAKLFAKKMQTTEAIFIKEFHLEDHGIVLMLHEAESGLRVSLVTSYYNRAKRPQLSWFMKDFGEDENGAIELFDKAAKLEGFMVFGQEFRLSKGSGLRLGKNYN